jgi:hypothetical protein
LYTNLSVDRKWLPKNRGFTNICKSARILLMRRAGEVYYFMNTVTHHKNLGLMAFVVAAAVMLIAGVGSAHAQYRRNDPYYGGNNGNYGRNNRVDQKDVRKAYERGYKEGRKDGKRAARNGSNRNDRYGNRGYGTYGNNGRYGNGNYGGGQIQRAYQDGYNRGYQEEYDRNYRNNRNRRYSGYGNRSVFGIPLPY